MISLRHRRHPRALAAAAAAAASMLVLAAPTPVAANGRFPAAGQLVVDPGDPSHLVLRVTYGILQSEDAGASWYWACEQAVGFFGEEDPAMGLTDAGPSSPASPPACRCRTTAPAPGASPAARSNISSSPTSPSTRCSRRARWR